LVFKLMESQQLSKNQETGYSPRVAILIGLVLSLAAGFLNVVIGMLPGPFGFSFPE